jgi:hypothetical protein
MDNDDAMRRLRELGPAEHEFINENDVRHLRHRFREARRAADEALAVTMRWKPPSRYDDDYEAEVLTWEAVIELLVGLEWVVGELREYVDTRGCSAD